MIDDNTIYLGDGLYAEYNEDEEIFVLMDSLYSEVAEHIISLNHNTLEVFLAYIKRMRGD